MKLYTLETDDVIFTGDLHGEFSTINVTINTYNLENCAIIFCGDIGLGFEKEEHYRQIFNHITKTIKKRNIHLYMFRGNHDDKSYFDGEHFTEYEYIHVIPDYSIIQTPLRNILCVGGATSIDRTLRRQNMNILAIKYMKYHECTMDEAIQNSQKLYWEDEAIIYDENELNKIDASKILIDVICTHTAPTFCQPLTKNGIRYWLDVDSNLVNDLDDERVICDKLLEYLKGHNHPITNWYYGHFHFSNVEHIDGIKYTLLDMARSIMDLSLNPFNSYEKD